MKEEICGTWKLVGMKNYFADGTVIDTFKGPFEGISIYMENNIAAVFVDGTLSDGVLERSPVKAADEVRRRTFRAYWARYEIDEEAQVVRHHFLGGSKHLQPVEERGLKFVGNRMILTKRNEEYLEKGGYADTIYERWSE
ncbi:MAG: lipocalin-like domain-containing protein [Candidatus Parabeggiatoa sp.]|nr:lipocalin-like domain-containing protein [Candidatus Parabeggiatoa sp.]